MGIWLQTNPIKARVTNRELLQKLCTPKKRLPHLQSFNAPLCAPSSTLTDASVRSCRIRLSTLDYNTRNKRYNHAKMCTEKTHDPPWPKIFLSHLWAFFTHGVAHSRECLMCNQHLKKNVKNAIGGTPFSVMLGCEWNVLWKGVFRQQEWPERRREGLKKKILSYQ